MDNYTVKELEVLLGSNLIHGLSQKEAEKRLHRDGYNQIEQPQNQSFILVFLEQFKDPMVFILIIASFLSILLHEIMDALIIFVVILMNALIGSFQFIRSQQALEALKQMVQSTCLVRRDSVLQEIAVNQIVVGDIIEFEAGDCIPCDIRLIHTTHLKMDESLLTGESQSIHKSEFVSGNNESSHQQNCVYMSTMVISGRGKGIAIQCGMNTQVGKIADLLYVEKQDLTPLQKRMNQMSQYLGIFAILICACMFLIALRQGKNSLEMLLLAISLAVAAIPEGLLAVVTIVQSFGVSQMSQKNALVRHLHAVETLGSVSVICSDKTGTLTQNQMSVVSTYENHHFDTPCSKEMLQCMGLCHHVSIHQEELLGDPSEKALVQFVKDKLSLQELACEYVMVDEIPFDSIRKKMTTIHQHDQAFVAFSKGSWERIIESCQLSNYEKQRIEEAAHLMEKQALRVFAFAYKKMDHKMIQEGEKQMHFLGLVGLIDPPRSEVAQAIEQCKKASIRLIMITGDSAQTAFAIAQKLKIAQKEDQVMSGYEIDACNEEELTKKCQSIQVFARVSPAHKVRIVNCLKKQNEIVAMSGDGVNDAPALKNADIGIAMGLKGSDVCKSASDILLLDDNFATILKAVEAGRNIYKKIQKSIFYLLSCNLGEIMTLFMSIVLLPSLAPPLLAVQMLWTNLVTDAIPALALGMEADQAHVMEEKPLNPKESLFAHGGMIFILCNGLWIGTMSLVAFRMGLYFSEKVASTMTFMVLSISQMFHALNCRHIHQSMFVIGFFKNKLLLFSVFCGIALQIMVAQLPFFNTIFKTTPLTLHQWFWVGGLSISVIVINEISKYIGNQS